MPVIYLSKEISFTVLNKNIYYLPCNYSSGKRDVLEGVTERVREVVCRVNAPLVASSVVMGELDTIRDGVNLAILKRRVEVSEPM